MNRARWRARQARAVATEPLDAQGAPARAAHRTRVAGGAERSERVVGFEHAALGLGGDGAPALLPRARTATFILVGEGHGFADVPRFVRALDAALGAAVPKRLAAEVGPLGTQRLAHVVGGEDATALARRHPGSTPCFGWQDDLALARRYGARGGPDALWGVGQEFILAATPHLEALRALAPQAGHAALDELLARAYAADRAVIGGTP